MWVVLDHPSWCRLRAVLQASQLNHGRHTSNILGFCDILACAPWLNYQLNPCPNHYNLSQQMGPLYRLSPSVVGTCNSPLSFAHLHLVDNRQGTRGIHCWHQETLKVHFCRHLRVIPCWNPPPFPFHGVQVDREVKYRQIRSARACQVVAKYGHATQ